MILAVDSPVTACLTGGGNSVLTVVESAAGCEMM